MIPIVSSPLAPRGVGQQPRLVLGRPVDHLMPGPHGRSADRRVEPEARCCRLIAAAHAPHVPALLGDQVDQIGAVLVEAAGEAQDANAPRARELAHAAGIGRLTRDELEARTRTLCQDVEEGLELGVVRHSARDELTGAVSVEEVGRQPE